MKENFTAPRSELFCFPVATKSWHINNVPGKNSLENVPGASSCLASRKPLTCGVYEFKSLRKIDLQKLVRGDSPD
jgi:hypothetical protein